MLPRTPTCARLSPTPDLPDISEHLLGQTAFVTGESDVCGAAKTIKNFVKEFKKPEVKTGILDGDVLDAAQIKALADLPSREVLLAHFWAPSTHLLPSCFAHQRASSITGTRHRSQKREGK